MLAAWVLGDHSYDAEKHRKMQIQRVKIHSDEIQIYTESRYSYTELKTLIYTELTELKYSCTDNLEN